MTDIHEALLQKVREWLIHVTGLSGGRVIPSDDAGTRPQLPYLTVTVSVSDIEEGTDETHFDYDASDDELDVSVTMDRRATASINAYGRRGATLLAAAQRSLSKPSVQSVLDDLKIGVEANSDIQDVSELVDSEREKRFVRDFDVRYRLRTEDEPVPYLESFEGELTMESDESTEPHQVQWEID